MVGYLNSSLFKIKYFPVSWNENILLRHVQFFAIFKSKINIYRAKLIPI